MMCSDYGFFFFKQKTAYEMRISDWSSDVCSSDLDRSQQGGRQNHDSPILTRRSSPGRTLERVLRLNQQAPAVVGLLAICFLSASRPPKRPNHPRTNGRRGTEIAPVPPTFVRRSEEHTSELQSLMRISYAVFCLKKK